jgi:diadenosine tetraphosphate (Ap4A) HIT family hydrolase
LLTFDEENIGESAAKMIDYKNDRIGSCERGENPTLMVKMKSGFAVIGDTQFLPGYCILLGYPKAGSLNELPVKARAQYLTDTALIGDAIIQVCAPLRLNYATMMNYDHYLHTHIIPRYDWEPDEYKTVPSFFYPKEERNKEQFQFNEQNYCELKCKIADSLRIIMKEAYEGDCHD